tara:strand:+ start:494 stop:1864 length:1371 start_codon:yes stop_codon:yes gene_type:complete
MKNLNEELNKMRKLMNFDISQNSHDVLSESNINESIIEEQDKKTLKQMLKNGEITKDEYRMMLDGTIPNWGTAMEGKIKMGVISSIDPRAMNIGVQKYRLFKVEGIISTVPPNKGKDTPPVTPIPFESPNIKLIGDGSLPFADNMVTPAWDKFPNAKKKFDDLINKIVKFINVGGFDYIKSITIQGSADSARPTEDYPEGYPGLDHPDGIYGGITGDKERNQYLADTRAKQYALAIIDEVNEKTKKDISSKFIYKKGLNYFGSEGKERGPEFRSITLNIDATDIPGKKGVEGEYQDFESFRESQNIEGTIELLPLPEIKGLSDYIPVIRKKEGKLWIPNGGVFDGVDYTTVVNALDSDNSEGFNGKKYVDGIIQPNAMKIDNTVIPLGRISPAMERKSEYNKALKWVVVYGDYFMENNGRNCLIVKGEEQNGLVEVKNIMFGIRQTISAGQGQYDY